MVACAASEPSTPNTEGQRLSFRAEPCVFRKLAHHEWCPMPKVSQSTTQSAIFRVTPIKIAIVACVGLSLLLAIPLSFPIQNFCGDEGFYALATRNVMQGMK